MGCGFCSSGLGENCHGPLGMDDLECSCTCECHMCPVCGNPDCEEMGGDEPCRSDEEEMEY